MHRLSVITLAMIATALTCGAVGATTNEGEPRPLRARTVTYLLHASFSLDYTVDWVETTGDQLSECSYWTDDRGSNNVLAGTVKTRKRRREKLRGMPGRIVIFPAARTDTRTGGWADFAAVGRAAVHIGRRLVQRGGYTPGCGSPAPPPFRPPTNDCGEHVFGSPNATLRADGVGNEPTLKSLTTSTRAVPYTRVIAITAVPDLHAFFRRCRTSEYAPGVPANLPLPITNDDLAELRSLRPGQEAKIAHSLAGDCDDDLPGELACRFVLDATVKIVRWNPRDPRTPYP